MRSTATQSSNIPRRVTLTEAPSGVSAIMLQDSNLTLQLQLHGLTTVKEELLNARLKIKTVCCICMERDANCKLEPCRHTDFCVKCIIKTLRNRRLRCPDCGIASQDGAEKFCIGCTYYIRWNHLWKCPICRGNISKVYFQDKISLLTPDLLRVMHYVNQKKDL
jgi:hypothetical protein